MCRADSPNVTIPPHSPSQTHMANQGPRSKVDGQMLDTHQTDMAVRRITSPLLSPTQNHRLSCLCCR